MVRGHESKSEEMSVLEHFWLRTVAFPPLPTRSQLMAVYPALLFQNINEPITEGKKKEGLSQIIVRN